MHTPTDSCNPLHVHALTIKVWSIKLLDKQAQNTIYVVLMNVYHGLSSL